MRILAITPELPSESEPGSMAPAARQLQSLRAIGVDVVSQDMRGIPKLKYLHAVPRMRRALKDVDLVHAHFGYCGLLARLQFRRPVVVSFMGDDLLGTPIDESGNLSRSSRLMVRVHQQLARYVNQIIVKSREMADVISPIPCHVIPNGVDIELFRPRERDAARDELGWDRDQTYVLFPGDPDNPRKGFRLAQQSVEVAQRLLGREVRIVTLWGVAPDRVATHMNACNAMWMTSFIEGSPNVVKEAMACNLSVVGVPVGDVPQLLDGVVGSFVCNREPEELGLRMAEAISSNAEPGGRRAIKERSLDMDSIARRIVDVYRLALDEFASNSRSVKLAASTSTTGARS